MPNAYLITGGAGFIGSHLAEVLLERGDRVVALDDLSTGRRSNLRRVANNSNFELVVGSVLDELMVDELVHRCDVVVHLAAAVGVKLIVEQPLRSFTTNIRGSEIVVGSAHRYRRKILVAPPSRNAYPARPGQLQVQAAREPWVSRHVQQRCRKSTLGFSTRRNACR